MLWFAFVLWITFDWYQRTHENEDRNISCDLLSFFELHLIDTNACIVVRLPYRVVICFRSLNYIWLIPTNSKFRLQAAALWFAFVLWITFDWYQQSLRKGIHLNSCDLLSFFELHLIDTNTEARPFSAVLVVICFRSLNYIWLIPTTGR